MLVYDRVRVQLAQAFQRPVLWVSRLQFSADGADELAHQATLRLFEGARLLGRVKLDVSDGAADAEGEAHAAGDDGDHHGYGHRRRLLVADHLGL